MIDCLVTALPNSLTFFLQKQVTKTRMQKAKVQNGLQQVNNQTLWAVLGGSVIEAEQVNNCFDFTRGATSTHTSTKEVGNNNGSTE